MSHIPVALDLSQALISKSLRLSRSLRSPFSI